MTISVDCSTLSPGIAESVKRSSGGFSCELKILLVTVEFGKKGMGGRVGIHCH